MSVDTSSYLPIEDAHLDKFSDKANLLLKKVRWAPENASLFDKVEKERHKWRDSSIRQSAAEELSLYGNAKRVSKDPLLLSEPVNHVLMVVRRGLEIGMHISALYTKFSGLEGLMALNRDRGLSEGQKTEFRQKYRTAAAMAIFSAAYYVVWKLSEYRSEDVNAVNMKFRGIPEMTLTAPVRAFDCMVFYYVAYLERSGVVHTDLEFIKMTLLYFQGIIDEIKNREASLQHTEIFVSKSYKLAREDFCLNGFQVQIGERAASIEFNRVELGEIVGNRDAKHKARRLAERLLCYDKNTRRNPMGDLGGLPTVRMGHGEPGTGKSLQIAATATMLHDFCQAIDLPFLFWPMPDNLVSTFQGGSAERTIEWMKPLKDPDKIVYAPVDDAENNLEDRTRQGVSAGVREVIGVFLRNTEGAYAVNYGNVVIELFTNLPEQLDKAVLSRIMDRFYMGGAMTREDFLDQDFLWWRRFNEIDPNFIDMIAPRDYEFLSEQRLAPSISKACETLEKPSEDRIRVIFDQVLRKHKPPKHDFFAHFFHAVKQAYPFFTSRDVRNIQSSINERIMDFDLDPGWLDDPTIFFLKEYEIKKEMIVELMKANMKGLSFADIRLQETIRYLDSMSKIIFAAEDRQLDEMVSEMLLREKAARRVSEMKQGELGKCVS